MKKIYLVLTTLLVFVLFAYSNTPDEKATIDSIKAQKKEESSINQDKEQNQSSTTLVSDAKDANGATDLAKKDTLSKLDDTKTVEESQEGDQNTSSASSEKKDKEEKKGGFNELIVEPIKILWKTLIGILFLAAISFLIIKIYKTVKVYISAQLKIEEKLAKIENNIDHLKKELSDLKSSPTLKQQSMDEHKKRQNILEENKLTDVELNNLKEIYENNWLTIAASQIGLSHLKSNPPTPCQDNHFHKSMNNDWQLAIVCDGAGSSKYSHIGSALMAKVLLPQIFDKYLQTQKWYIDKKSPLDIEWRELSIKALKECHLTFINKIQNEFENKTIKEYACTVILTLYNSTTALILNVGDGRGGYLNKSGYFKPLFVPYKGEESNSTVFITSPIWDNPDIFIQTSIINEPLLSVFILSDGMEKVSFNCSLMEEGIWSDPNIPFKKFFYPILTQMNNTPKGKENDLQTMWENFLISGHKDIANESDDKTMIVSLLK